MSAESLERAFAKVEASASPLLGGDFTSKDSVLRAIFSLNNEIGKLARLKPGKLGTLKMLQAYVNAITVAVKGGEARPVRESLESARDFLISATDELKP
jgi:hypothetical protein